MVTAHSSPSVLQLVRGAQGSPRGLSTGKILQTGTRPLSPAIRRAHNYQQARFLLPLLASLLGGLCEVEHSICLVQDRYMAL